MIREDISRLRKNRGLHFSIGLSTALLLSIFALNYEVATPVYDEQEIEWIDNNVDIEPIVTKWPERKPPPPPQPKLSPIIIPDPDPTPTIDLPEIEKDEVEISPTTTVKKPIPVEKTRLPPKPLPEPEVDEILAIAQVMPQFGDCDDIEDDRQRRICSDKNILQYIHSKIKYPSIARENNVQGNVVVTFVIDKKGNLTQPKILREIGAGCGDEVLRVLKDMPKWTAGRQHGKAVNVQFNLPIRFTLE